MSLNGQIKQTIQYNKQNKPLFSDPKLVTENINGDICVVDDYRTVVVVNKDGQFSLKYPESGKSTHTIGDCSGIACDKLGYILISDYVNSQIHQIDSDGKFVQFVLTEQHGIEKPLGLSIDDKGQLWVCYKNGTELVTENINGDICVVDDYSAVVVVDKGGQFRFKYSESGKSTHTIDDCYGIVCDKLGYILISDYRNNRIHQIDSDGKFVQFVLTEQHGIRYPRGLSIDDKGQLWVCNNDSFEVRVYNYPMLVIENINGDVCVMHMDDYRTVVSVVNNDGQFRFRYPESDKSTHTIGFCYGIARDKLRYILISDYRNSLIHQIDSDRKFNDNKVVRMSLNGQIKQTIQYNKQNKPLFICPILVTENINGDVYVVDDEITVDVVNKDGQFRFKYPESGKSTRTIGYCYGIACDKLGYMLISDCGNSRIHQINSDGKFVQFVLTEQHGIEKPLGLSIDDKGQLWDVIKWTNQTNHTIQQTKQTII
ncbi:hypothetical protein KUTeg_024367 [Tegillarca granosa]|uniref:Uncharacterized protein n=1 Tax=Tegillarca granosa TaxID=220873 RepID=A0ABQ9E289_TEGGR|nr:hypothetical protein KUTeg_024367 [Tegillarca granosa]